MVFTPFRLRELELKNRWIMLAMHTGFATGNALTERDYAFYEERAKGGAAAVTVLLAVNEAGALKGMYDAETVEKESLRTLAERVHAHDCRLIVQLFHCGRNESAKNHGEKPLLAPSAVASPIFRTEPQEMTAEQLPPALDGLSQASVELLGVLQSACRMPCAADCEKDMEDGPQVPDSIRPLLMLSGCCPSALAQLLEEGDIVYAAE